jgi:hypothetical protein
MVKMLMNGSCNTDVELDALRMIIIESVEEEGGSNK